MKITEKTLQLTEAVRDYAEARDTLRAAQEEAKAIIGDIRKRLDGDSAQIETELAALRETMERKDTSQLRKRILQEQVNSLEDQLVRPTPTELEAAEEALSDMLDSIEELTAIRKEVADLSGEIEKEIKELAAPIQRDETPSLAPRWAADLEKQLAELRKL